jgi:hypothetical protein
MFFFFFATTCRYLCVAGILIVMRNRLSFNTDTAECSCFTI